jgi:uncharacterized protein YdeI (YjbR/CyaY-like superfamily)
MNPVFFATPDELRAWLIEHHDSERELWVGLHKKSTGRASITWPELVDQLLCFGWIDGVRKSIDADSYTIRVTPRRPDSTWSVVNLRRARELIDEGAMEPPGRAAFEAVDEGRTNRYSFERDAVELGEEYEAELLANPRAWEYFRSQPPSYRKTITWWVMSAKREDTRRRRLAKLIQHSEEGRRLGP